ncbi:hypothetical protein ANCCAN_24505 [Ancylostoma caninum]|uniref:Uncharacterized protein n=2 Tax=Ancylostoma caninum TaxID=29170 RepID=A0A368FCC9_ANCCA|nr:hypothetical protein ANCCAN_24505 [Ancylostoma caninum]
MKDRKKAPPFHECELRLLMKLYCDSYEEYHGRGKHGESGRSLNDKKSLLRRFAREVSNLGFYQRTEKQIEERLRADCKRVRKHERARIHEGREAVINSLPSYLHQLYECRKSKSLNGSAALNHDEELDDHHLDITEDSAFEMSQPSICHKVKVEVITPREGSPAGEPQSSETFMEMEEVVDEAAPTSTTPTQRRMPRKYVRATRPESPSPSMDRRAQLYEEEIKLSMLRQQLAIEELKLIVIKNDLARAQLERETIATERERFELERAKHEQYSEELKLFHIKQDLARAQLEREMIALERERLKLEREKQQNNNPSPRVTSQSDNP